MSVLIIIFLTAVLALFAGVFEKGKFSRYIGILGLILAFYVSFLPELAFFSQYKHMFEFGPNAALFTKITLVITLLIFYIIYLSCMSCIEILPIFHKYCLFLLKRPSS